MTKKNHSVTVVGTRNNEDIKSFIAELEANIRSIDDMCQRKELNNCTRDLILNLAWCLTHPMVIKKLETLLRDEGSFNQMFPYADDDIFIEFKKAPRELAKEIRKLVRSKMPPIQ
jgi:hypothetical protein